MVSKVQLSRALDWYWNGKSKFKSRGRTEKSKSKGTPFVVIYLSLNCLNKFIRDNIYLFYMNEEWRIYSFQDTWCHLKVSVSKVAILWGPNYIHSPTGSKKCAKTCCEVCDYVTDTDTFTSTMTGESLKINHQLNCDDRCITYLKHASNVRNNILEKLWMI